GSPPEQSVDPLTSVMVGQAAGVILHIAADIPRPVGDLDMLHKKDKGVETANLQEFVASKSGEGSNVAEGEQREVRPHPGEEIIVFVGAPHSSTEARHLASIAENIPLLIKDLPGDGEDQRIPEVFGQGLNTVFFQAYVI